MHGYNLKSLLASHDLSKHIVAKGWFDLQGYVCVCEMLIICYCPSHKFTETIQGGSKVDVKEKGVLFPLSDQIDRLIYVFVHCIHNECSNYTAALLLICNLSELPY